MYGESMCAPTIFNPFSNPDFPIIAAYTLFSLFIQYTLSPTDIFSKSSIFLNPFLSSTSLANIDTSLSIFDLFRK